MPRYMRGTGNQINFLTKVCLERLGLQILRMGNFLGYPIRLDLVCLEVTFGIGIVNWLGLIT